MFRSYKRDNGGRHEFMLTKRIIFDGRHTEETARNHADLYLKLKRDRDFGRIKIPQFDVNIHKNVVTLNIEFIKGFQWTTHDFRKHALLIRDNLVYKEGKYTFTDYSPHNFLYDFTTNDIYYVDLESYRFCPIEERELLLKEKKSEIGFL